MLLATGRSIGLLDHNCADIVQLIYIVKYNQPAYVYLAGKFLKGKNNLHVYRHLWNAQTLEQN